MRLRVAAAVLSLLAVASAYGGAKFLSDPKSPELRKAAELLVVDESRYGCGPMLNPGKTYYVSLKGNDKADGLSWETALRHVWFGASRLKAGDTLLIGEGEYTGEHILINVPYPRYYPEARRDKLLVGQVGEPGRPIRIMAAPRSRVTITNAVKIGPFSKTPGLRWTYEATGSAPGVGLWEGASLVRLQNAGSKERVDELPGTYAFDESARKLYVRFSDPRPVKERVVYAQDGYATLRIHSSYVRVKGIRFKHGGLGVIVRSNMGTMGQVFDPKAGAPYGGARNTVEDCVFYSNSMAGMDLCLDARWNLVRNNRGFLNGHYGSIKWSGSKTHDNLMIGNRCDPSPPTIRALGSNYHYAIHKYSSIGDERNHLINNVLNDRLAIRWKPASKQCVFQGNVAVGSVYCTGTAKWFKAADRMILRSNVLLGRVSWSGEEFGPGGAGGDWVAPDKAFINNFHGNRDAKAVAAARFADPAWLDFRLQSDSPLKGKAVGGGDRGAFRRAAGRALYVGPKGDDANAGTSARLAFRTLGRAAAELRPGDALYVMKGKYAGPLLIRASGAAERPIHVRAYSKARFAIPGVVISGRNVIAQGLVVAGSRGDGIVVSAPNVRVARCLVHGARGAGLRARSAAGLVVERCTFTRNGTGVALDKGTVDATLGNNVVAANRTAAVRVSADSRRGLRRYNNCYSGPGVDAEPGSVAAAPGFVDPGKGDFRLQWDSPAAFLGEFGGPAGGEPVLGREAEISDIRVTSSRRGSAVVSWRTPLDDTSGKVYVRGAGAKSWRLVGESGQGTVHAVGITGLKTGADYEIKAEALSRRGRDAFVEVRNFRTATRSRPPAVIHLSPTGDDRADGLSARTAWRTIRKANVELQPGDTLLMAPGVYRHAIAPINSGLPGRRITYKRHGNGRVLIDGGGVITPLVSLKRRSYVTIDGVTLHGGWTRGSGGRFYLEGCKDVAILNCRALPDKRAAGSSVFARGCRGLRIEGNCFTGARYQLYICACPDMLVKNNTFLRNSVVSVIFYAWPHRARIINNIFSSPASTRNNNYWFLVKRIGKLEMDYNLYTVTPKHGLGRMEMTGKGLRKLKFQAPDLAKWQKETGWDKHGVQGDPMFVNPEKGDFRLKPNSPAIGRGKGGATIGALGVGK